MSSLLEVASRVSALPVHGPFRVARKFSMEFVLNCRNVARSVRSVINDSYLLSVFTEDVALSKQQKRDRQHQSKTRLRVLRRDHYRCRGCDKTGDEVTLEIYQLQPHSFDPEDLITVCTPCQTLIERLRLSADQIPDLLRQLWAHLYPRRDKQCRS
jgi:5-methylcytosine-specific restriction endonuclease McrA